MALLTRFPIVLWSFRRRHDEEVAGTGHVLRGCAIHQLLDKMADSGSRRKRRVLKKPVTKSSLSASILDASRYNSLKPVLILLCVLTVLFAFVCFAIWRGAKASNGHSPVPVLVAEDPRDFATTLAKMGRPVVVKDTIVSEWKALKHWSPSYLASRVGKFSGVYVNNNRWFGPYYDGRKPLTKYCPRSNPYLTDLVVPAEDFFQLLFKPNHGEYMYYTGDVDSVGLWAFDQIQPIEELLRLNPKSSSVNVWIGQPRVIAHCHYDGYHNFYVQLYGHKRFKLYHPSNWPGLYPYPFLHPSHAQAQVNLSHQGSRKRFSSVNRVEWFETVLGPGDLLYIPPLWFHEVESLDVR